MKTIAQRLAGFALLAVAFAAFGPLEEANAQRYGYGRYAHPGYGRHYGGYHGRYRPRAVYRPRYRAYRGYGVGPRRFSRFGAHSQRSFGAGRYYRGGRSLNFRRGYRGRRFIRRY